MVGGGPDAGMMQEWGVIIAGGGLAVLILTTVGGLIWKLSRIEISVRAEAAEQINALREKLYQFEIWARDAFVRKGSFEQAVSRIERGMDNLGTKLDGAVDKMTERFDSHTRHVGRTDRD